MNAASRLPAKQAAVAALCLVLGACMLGPEYRTPPVPEPQDFYGFNARVLARAEPEISWWAELQDPILNRLIVRAVRHNHNLRIARANLRTARHAGRAALSAVSNSHHR